MQQTYCLSFRTRSQSGRRTIRVLQIPISGRRPAQALAFPILLGALVGLVALEPALLAVVGIVVVVVWWTRLVVRDHVRALAVFLAFMPVWFYLQIVDFAVIHVPDPVSGLTLLKEGLLVVYFLHWLVVLRPEDEGGIRLTTGMIVFFLVVVVGIGKAAVLGSISPVELLFNYRPYVEMFLLVGVPLLSVDLDRNDIRNLLTGFLVGGAGMATVALYHYFVDPYVLLRADAILHNQVKVRPNGEFSALLGPRLQSITGNPNDLANVMLVTSLLTLGFLLESGRRLRQAVPLAGLLFVSLLVLSLASSRDDLVMFGFGLAIVAVHVRRHWATVLGGVFFVVGIWLNSARIVTVFRRLVESGNPRVTRWVSAIEHFGTDLVFGIGTVANEWTASTSIDSTTLRMLIQIGLVGTLAYAVYNARIMVNLSRLVQHARQSRAMPLAILASLVALQGVFVFRVGLFLFPFTAYYWILLALGIRLIDLRGTRNSTMEDTTETSRYSPVN